jgi:Pvc16 N-terminal domain
MSDYKVIADAGDSLINVLWAEIQTDPDLAALISDKSLISLESPATHEHDNDTALLSIYLYRIVEDPHMKNGGTVTGTGAKQRQRPLALDLFYLVTPLLKAPRDQQIVLGKVMRVLYDHPTLDGADLAGSLAGSGEAMRVILNPLSLEEIARVWQALEISYRLSVCYTVRVAMLDSTREQFVQPVVHRTSTYEGN